MCSGAKEDRCDYTHGNSGAGNTAVSNTGYGNDLTYMKFMYYDSKTRGAVMTFNEPNCQGVAGRFYSPAEFGVTADFTSDEMYQGHAFHDHTYSAYIPYGTSMTLYKNDGWGGESIELVGRNFADTNDRMECRDFRLEGNDDMASNVSSIRVYKTGGGYARGYWYNAGSGHSVQFTMNVGYDNSSTQRTEETQQNTLSYEMSSSFEFDGIGGSDTISESYSYQLTTATESTYSMSMSASITVTCQQTDGGQIGLWQWITESSDATSKAFTALAVCRSGDGIWNKAPECPYTACYNGDCTICENGWKK